MKKIPLLVLLVVSSVYALACDACGCAIGGMGFGYVPFQKNHFVGLSYQQHHFETAHPAVFSSETEEISNDQFQTLQIWGRFFVKDRYLITGFIPVKRNTVSSASEKEQIQGLGDVRVQAQYLVKSIGNAMDDNQLAWYAGMGAFLPMGKVDENTRVHLPALQPGSGAFGVELNSTFSARKGDLGLRSEFNVRTNGKNKYNYKFGDELNANLVLFYRWKLNRFRLIPQTGVSILSRNKDVENTTYDVQNSLSGASLFSSVVGLSIYTEKVGLRCFYTLPVHYTISNGYTTPKQLTNLQFLYLIPSKK